jgi:hypothetical protein
VSRYRRPAAAPAAAAAAAAVAVSMVDGVRLSQLATVMTQ